MQIPKRNKLVLAVAALLVLPIPLKVFHMISWPWGWVLAPFWVPLGAVTLGILICIIAIVIDEYLNNKDK